MLESQRVLKNVEYTIEVWGVNYVQKKIEYVADLSDIVVNGLNFSWKLNDIEEISFDIDLIQFENKCKDMGVEPENVLTPYRHDIRLRRNGEYIMGAQVVETNITVNNDAKPTLAVRCTGFLNIFKDRYCPLPMSGWSYSKMASMLVRYSQCPPWANKNPTIEYPNDEEEGTDEVGINYWIPRNGTVSVARQNNIMSVSQGDRGVTIGGYPDTEYLTHTAFNNVLKVVPDSSNVASVATRAYSSGGYGVGVAHGYVACTTSCTVSVYLSKLVNSPLGTTSYQEGKAWKLYDVRVPAKTWTDLSNLGTHNVEPWSDDFYVIFSANTSGTLMFDDVYIKTGRSSNPWAGVDVVEEEISGQKTDRSFYQELQSTKDALMDLCSREEDKFEFWFDYDRTYHQAKKKEGAASSGLWLEYPGNIHTLTIQRTAADLANRVINIGSGIGDERLQAEVSDYPSQQTYGLRAYVETNNSVTLRPTLYDQANAILEKEKKPTNLPAIVVRDGSVNPGNLKVGQTVVVKMFDHNYLSSIDGEYRVVEMTCQTNLENVEQVALTLEKV